MKDETKMSVHNKSNLKRSVSTMTLSECDQEALREPHKNQTLRPNPFELHWRSAGPKWKGNLDNAFKEKYPHLADEIYCRYCGAIPCPLDYDDITATRLKDLEFVRELVKEKKDLEAKYKELQENLTDIIKQTETWREEKVMLHAEMKLAERRRQEWDFERKLMEAEINRLKTLNDKHLTKLVNYRKDQHRLVDLSERVKILEQENEKLKLEAHKARHALMSQMEDSDRFERENKRLRLELDESNTKVKSLTDELEGLEEERERHRMELAERDAKIKHVEDEMTQIIKELEVQTKTFTEKEGLSKSLIEELRHHMLEIKNKLEMSEQYGSHLEQQIHEHLTVIEQLRYKLANDKRFAKFVAIKRECHELKHQNEALMSRSQVAHAYSIPMLNAEGRVTSPYTSGRMAMGMLQIRRAKSASVYTSREKIYGVRKIKDALKLDNLD